MGRMRAKSELSRGPQNSINRSLPYVSLPVLKQCPDFPGEYAACSISDSYEFL